jgi:hypothetical protein
VGLLPWLKNEGWLWLGLISFAWVVSLAVNCKLQIFSRKQFFGLVSLYFLIVLLIPLLWQYFLLVNGTQRFTFEPVIIGTLWANASRVPEIAGAVIRRLLNPYWNFVWLFAALVLLFRRQMVLEAPAGWLVLLVSGYLFLVNLTYLFSRFEPYLAHLNNSVERLIVQAVPLILLWLIGQGVSLGWVSGQGRGTTCG